jgi:hypothetical protein
MITKDLTLLLNLQLICKALRMKKKREEGKERVE